MLNSRIPLREYVDSVAVAFLREDEKTLARLLDDFLVDDFEAVLKPGKSNQGAWYSPDLKPP